MWIAISVASAFLVAAALSSRAVGPRIAGPHRAAGLAVTWLGLAIRVWAVAVLGRSFRTTVEVDPQQAVIATGPYRWVRHPSYTGLLLILAGYGVATGYWLALVASIVVPLPAVLRRIRVEEAELTRVLGGEYRAYQVRTNRLVPGLW